MDVIIDDTFAPVLFCNDNIPVAPVQSLKHPFLHGFKFLRVPGFPGEVVKSQDQDTGGKWDHGQVLESKIPKQGFAVKTGKLTDHPVRIGCDPDRDGKVMTKLRHQLPCSPGDNDRNDQRGKNHRNTQRPPDHTPGHIFE